MRIMPFRDLRTLRRAVLISIAPLLPLAAQGGSKAKAPASSTPKLVGTWSGTATVPLKDSTIVVPVIYNFTQTGTVIGGMAMVPGQGQGPISNVVRDGAKLQFRVTAPEGRLLEHDGKFGPDGAIEGMVNLDNLPIAKFRIVQKPPAPKPPAPKSPAPKSPAH
jgi:hypothetical protein